MYVFELDIIYHQWILSLSALPHHFGGLNFMPKKWKEYNRLPERIRGSLKPLNDLSGSEWSRLSKSVNTFNGPIANKRKTHGASYPISLAKHFIQIYTAEGDTVLDPFLGVGTTTDAAQLLGRNGIGIEINRDFINLAKEGVDKIDQSPNDFNGDVNITYHLDTSENLKKYVKKETIDLVLTSPPYSSLLNKTIENFGGSDYSKNIYKGNGRTLAKPYSNDGEDMGNLAWDSYCNKIGNLMQNLLEVCRPGSYNVWVVRDFRDMEKSTPYVNLHGKIIELATAVGWVLVDIIVWDQTAQRQLVKMGGPKTRRFYFNIGHSYIVVFRKNILGEAFQNVD